MYFFLCFFLQNGLDFEDEDPIWDFSSDEGAGQEVQWTQLKPKLAGTAGNFRRSDSLHWNSDTDEDLVMASQAAEAYLWWLYDAQGPVWYL